MNTTKSFYEEYNYKDVIKNVPEALHDYLTQENIFLQSYIKNDDSVLEIGCGYGRALPLLAENAKSVVGIDYSSLLVTQAKSLAQTHANIKVELMDATKLDLNDVSFDKVVCLGHTFGNFENAENLVLKEMHRVLKICGEIYFSVLNSEAKEDHIQFYKNNNFTIIEHTQKYIRLKEGLYSKRFTKNDLADLMIDSNVSNFEIVEFTPISYQVFVRK